MFGIAGVQTALLTIFYNGDDGDGVFSFICDRPNLDFSFSGCFMATGSTQEAN